MKTELLLVGAGSIGGFLSLNLKDFDLDYHLLGFLDDDPSKYGKKFWDVPVIGPVAKVFEYQKNIAIAICINNPEVKIKIKKQIENHTQNFPNFIHPKAWLSNHVRIGVGAIIYPGVSINYECSIGDFVTINMNCAIGHNCTIGGFSSLAPGVNFGGHTHIETEVDMGIGSATKQNVRVGQGSIVGGQCMLVRDVPPGTVYAGVPGRELSKKQ